MKPTTKVLVIGALFLTGCSMFGMPGPETNFLSGGNATIANAIVEAAADWARHGLEIARFVTVDDGRGGVTVRFAPKSEIDRYRTPGAPTNIAAATSWENGDWLHILVDDSLRTDPPAVVQALKHELIHVLVPKAPHHDGIGIFTPLRSSFTVTRADMDHLARFTKVTESEAPFESETA